MDQIQHKEDRKKIIAKLAKIQALAERGEGGEKVTALQMYEALKDKYGISDEEVQQAAAVPVDITQIDLKQYWGIVFSMGIIANNLQDELDFCNECPHTHTEEDCGECSTHQNIKGLQLQYEEMKRRLEKAAERMEMLHIDAYLRYIRNWHRRFLMDFLSGIVRGIGFSVGFSILGALLIYILRNIALANLPLIGRFLAELVRIVETNL